MTQQNNSGKSNRVSVPEAKAALNNMKYEIANELGVNLSRATMVTCPPARPVTSAATWSRR